MKFKALKFKSLSGEYLKGKYYALDSFCYAGRDRIYCACPFFSNEF